MDVLKTLIIYKNISSQIEIHTKAFGISVFPLPRNPEVQTLQKIVCPDLWSNDRKQQKNSHSPLRKRGWEWDFAIYQVQVYLADFSHEKPVCTDQVWVNEPAELAHDCVALHHQLPWIFSIMPITITLWFRVFWLNLVLMSKLCPIGYTDSFSRENDVEKFCERGLIWSHTYPSLLADEKYASVVSTEILSLILAYLTEMPLTKTDIIMLRVCDT